MTNGDTPVDAPNQPARDAEPPQQPAAANAAEEASRLGEDTEKLAEQCAELNDRLLRLRADYDNFRRRAERERADLFEYATMEAVRGLLPVLDDFERALNVAPKEEGPVRDYATGMQLIYQRFLDALKKLGLELVDATGQPFDPNLHHAVQKEVRDDVEDHTVLEQYQRGYNFKGKLLRAAMVKVAVKS
jgi:molecular chaperone GrpE